jgi:glutamate 5-kinase
MGVIDRLLIHDDVCVVNENDATSHAEIAFGDNDTLAARLAAKMRSSELFNSCVRLLILSDIDGVYTDRNDPRTVMGAINDIEQFKHLAGTASSSESTGGMETKFMAASIAKAAGVQTVIGNGRTEGIIPAMLENNAGTLFTVSS